jgi:hypothetical protein
MTNVKWKIMADRRPQADGHFGDLGSIGFSLSDTYRCIRKDWHPPRT